MIQDGQLVKFVNGGDAARIQKVQIAVGRDATRAPRVRHDLRGMPVQVVTGEDPTRAPFIHPFEGLAPAAWFRAGQGITVTGAGVSQWDDQSGNGRHLLQGTDAARPINLPFSGTRYLYLPGVAGNYASTPDSAANSITGDIDIRVRVALDDWTPAAVQTLFSKSITSGQYSYDCWVAITGALVFRISVDGTALSSATSSATTGGTDKTAYWLRITRASASGDVNFYTAADSGSEPSSWTQLGTTQSTTAGAIFNGNTALGVGANTSGANMSAGKIYRAIIKNGIDGTTVVDFNPADADGDGDTSFASSTTGETWTINSSGGLPAQIVGRASALFNGTSHYLKCSAFTLNQPTCVLMVVKQVSWTAGDRLFDGNANLSMSVLQNDGGAFTGGSPNLQLYAGSYFTATQSGMDALSLGAVGVLATLFNGASSLFRVNMGSAKSGSPGAANAGGFTMGSNGSGGQLSNIQVYETVIFPITPSTAQLDRLIAGVMARHGVS